MFLNRENHIIIKHRLELRGVSFSEIGRRLGVTHSIVIATSQGRSRSMRVEEGIANILECKPCELWPDRYKKEAAMK